MWTDGDLKIFAAGLAIGGRWNHTHGTLPAVKSTVPSGTYWFVPPCELYCDETEAVIFYSTDGSSPTNRYAGEEITISETMDIYAFAVLGRHLSAMSRFWYIIDSPTIQEETIDISAALPDLSEDAEIALDTVTLDAQETVDIALPEIIDAGEEIEYIIT